MSLSINLYIKLIIVYSFFFFFFQAEDGIRDDLVTGVQTCALPIWAFGLIEHTMVKICATAYFSIARLARQLRDSEPRFLLAGRERRYRHCGYELAARPSDRRVRNHRAVASDQLHLHQAPVFVVPDVLPKAALH